MAIRFQCPECGAGLKAGQADAGRELPCPRCGAGIQVPAAEAALAPPGDPLDETEPIGFGDTLAAPRPGAASPPPPPLPRHAPPSRPTPSAAPANAFASPRAPVARPLNYNVGEVRIVEIKLPFWSVARLIVQVWLVTLIFAAVGWLLVTGFLVLLPLLFRAAAGNGNAAP